jgi:hypothetical protein
MAAHGGSHLVDIGLGSLGHTWVLPRSGGSHPRILIR